MVPNAPSCESVMPASTGRRNCRSVAHRPEGFVSPCRSSSAGQAVSRFEAVKRRAKVTRLGSVLFPGSLFAAVSFSGVCCDGFRMGCGPAPPIEEFGHPADQSAVSQDQDVACVPDRTLGNSIPLHARKTTGLAIAERSGNAERAFPPRPTHALVPVASFGSSCRRACLELTGAATAATHRTATRSKWPQGDGPTAIQTSPQ